MLRRKKMLKWTKVKRLLKVKSKLKISKIMKNLMLLKLDLKRTLQRNLMQTWKMNLTKQSTEMMTSRKNPKSCPHLQK